MMNGRGALNCSIGHWHIFGTMLITLVVPVATYSQDSFQVAMDIDLFRAEFYFNSKQFPEGEAVLDHIREIAAAHRLELPASYDYLIARVLKHQGKFDDAVISLYRYLTNGRSPKVYYRAAQLLLHSMWGRTFVDCAEDYCPTMVIVPPGIFRMGSPESEEGRKMNEGPIHHVAIDWPMAVGIHEVSFLQWDECFKEASCEGHRPEQIKGRGAHPVINVSWNDTESFFDWLNEKLGLVGESSRYRLLGEAEWEYVARAGTADRFHFGDNIRRRDANYDGGVGSSSNNTILVFRKKPNAFKLHNVHGNVAEWTQDCWRENYDTGLVRGHPYDNDSCEYRVIRGGSWRHGDRALRSAARDKRSADERVESIGFRVARTLR